MNKSLTFLCLWLWALAAQAQMDTTATKFAQTITQADLKAHLEVLASDAYEGRETGTAGQKKAAQYIRQAFASYALAGIVPAAVSQDPYLQPFALEKSKYGSFRLAGKGKVELQLLQDFFSIQGLLTEQRKAKMVFAGYGMDTDKYSDYQNIDPQGKVLVMLMGEPKDSAGIYLATGTKQKSIASQPDKKIAVAKEKGALGVILLYESNEILENVLTNYADYFSQPRLGFPDPDKTFALYSAPERVASLFGKQKAKFNAYLEALLKDPTNVPAKAPQAKITLLPKASIEKVGSENVLAFLEGTDKKDEILVITAHYDHIGISPNGEINNGADDDGSGTVAVLEMAQAFAAAKAAGHGPRRSILFMTVSGEEKGLLGSEYYSDNPILPLHQTITNLNIDMIGRVDPKYEDENNPNYIYIIGSNMLSDSLHRLSERTAAAYGEVSLDYRYNDKDDPNRFYYRSDHYNFAKHNIPVIFYFNGTHADYHKPSDTVEKIHFPKMEKVARLIFLTAWQIANQEERITPDKLNR